MKYRFRRRIFYTLFMMVDKLFLLLPYHLAIKFGRFSGKFIFIVLEKYRRLTKEHLRVAFGKEKSEKEISKIARSVFINIGVSAAEILSLPKMKNRLDSIVEINGIERMDKALSAGNGVIAISAHFGNWEMIPIAFARKGYSSNVIARPIYYEKFNEWVSFMRNNMGVNIIYRTDSPKKILKLLRSNEIVGITPDQDIDSVEGIFVNFFGRKAYTPSAPVKIAMAANCPIVPVFIVRKGLKHTVYVEEPISIERGDDKDAIVREYTQRWSDIIEARIREHPDHWVWMHKRWKTKLPLSEKT